MDNEGSEAGPDESWIDEGRAALVCSPAGADRLTHSDADWLTHSNLLTPADADLVDLLCVSFSSPPVLRPPDLEERGVAVDRYAVATVGAEVGDAVDPDRTFSVDSLQALDHLSELGMYLRDVLADWAYDGHPSVVCFDSVDDLLDRADLELTFEFLLVVIEGIKPWGTTAHFHFDPEDHGGTTRRTLEPLFDDVIGLDDGAD